MKRIPPAKACMVLARSMTWMVLSFGLAVSSLAGCQRGASDTDDSCHIDCFGAIECRNGTVIAKSNTVLSCGGDEKCPQETVGTCLKGCAVDHLEEHPVCPMRICRENYPKQPGDVCATEADCHPTVPVWADGGIWQTYLRCDVAHGICVETAGPEIRGYLGRCDPMLMGHLQKGAYGVLADTTCDGGLCMYYAAHNEDCVYQGCTRACATDEECPQGSLCDGMDECLATNSSRYGYCKPGPLRNAIGGGLSCW